MDRNPDLFVHSELAQAGAFLEYDGPGRVKYFPESTLITLIRGMFDAGLGGNVLLGGDTAWRSYWKAYAGVQGSHTSQSALFHGSEKKGSRSSIST
jgi:phosphotriesterase-related protein